MAAIVAPQRKEAQATILIVEDDPGVATLERRRLERAGYATLTAAGAEEALDQLARHRVDLILLDYRLPGGTDGLTFYDQVRASGHSPPVILVTGFSSEATVIQALRAGVRDFVTKSVEYLDYLPEAVGRVLKQVRTEQELVESEARFRSLADSAPVFVWLTDEDGRSTFTNLTWQAFSGRPPPRGEGDRWTECVHPEDAEQFLQARREAFRARAPFAAEVRLRRGDGVYRWVLDTARPRFYPDGRFAGYTGCGIDITDRRQAEEALRASEQRYRAIVDTAGSVILSLTPDRRVREWNREAERTFGYAREEALGQDYLARFVPEAARDGVAAELAKALAGEPARGFEHPVRTREGGERVLQWNMTTLRPGSAEPEVIPIGQDVTDRKRLEQQYYQAQKMEAVGHLAGGVAHDFNNLLTVINGFTEILLSRLPQQDPSRGLLAEVYKAGERAASLTRQLLAFSRKQRLQAQLLDLNALVSEMQGMLGRMLGDDVRLETALDPGLGLVRADAAQMEQVLMNLAVNSRDAMPTGGRLTVTTANVELDEAYARDHPYVTPGRYVLLAVADTGVGMDAASRARVFEPFFSTKPPGRGTGLGLATVYGTVKQSGGSIEVDSAPGRGTAFRIYLPLAEGAAPPGKPRSGEFKIPRGTETLLVVDDEGSVRQIASVTLRTLGYNVLEAADAAEALRVSAAHQGEIHLLVTDVVMFGTSGPQLAAALTASRPGLRVLYVSGFADEALFRHGVAAGEAHFLQKPFTLGPLARMVREVLDAQHSQARGPG